MALSKYKQKRSFEDTPEPEGGKPSANELRFVVQKHDASHLHYDFRLEINGVLKSWAVPKGPSLNPEDKRLAMEVEDHPYDYKDFEGIIPKGNYGAGTVIVWDEGTYEPLDPFKDKKSAERRLYKQWKEGSIKVLLKGKKLKGEFALVKMKGQQENAWLMIKHKDKYASETDITAKDKSVLSKRTLAQVEKAAGKNLSKEAVKKTVKKTANVKKATIKKEAPKKENEVGNDQDHKEIDRLLRKAPKAAFPEFIEPMLATLVDEAFDNDDWEYEVKWDGYRALAFKNKKKTALYSRKKNSFSEKFYPVTEALKGWDEEMVVDGEIIALNKNGIPDFNLLQNWKSEEQGRLQYYVFDLLWYKGKNLMGLPLTERKAILAAIIPKEDEVIKFSDSLNVAGTTLFKQVSQMGLEGIMAKRSDSAYIAGNRSKEWLKIKAQKRQEVVIGGYTLNEGSSKAFSSLLLGVFEGKTFKYVGKVGTGFKEKEQKEMLAMFEPLIRKTSPFSEVPDIEKPSRFRPKPPKAAVVWLKPQLVCEVHYTEITTEGVFRHPAFIALRDDKKATSVREEKEIPTEAIVEDETEPNPQTPRRKVSNKNAVKVNGHELVFSNQDKVLWPQDGFTKGDLINYYDAISKYILPYLKDRPMSLHRFPDGIAKQSFYQKDMTAKVPDWVELYPYQAEEDNLQKNYMLCQNKAALLYMANLGAIDVNPWNSTVNNPENPTWCALDLDPDKSNTFEQVIEVAQAIHEYLASLKVPSYCKTSGSTGIHIYIPLANKYSYDQCQMFAKIIASQVNRLFDFTSIERMTSKRKGKIYIDYLQNRPGATLAAPYSVRPKPGATVSMPLHWEEVKKGLKMQDFTIENAIERVKSEGDIFKPVLGKGINLKSVLQRM
ncbi:MULTISPECIES: DNA ligase D [Sphingobacterium]|uniref:DNA ligase D n=1 Tax=Sphingobacterium TaxID=28453 RepID=UPI0028B0A3FC|nr:DNA ligase D [Sphingobacterium multivorum]